MLWRVGLLLVLWSLFYAPALLLIDLDDIDPITRLWLELAGAAALLLAAWIMVRRADHRSLVGLGFDPRRAGRDTALGLAVGAAMIALAVGVLWLADWTRPVPPVGFSWAVAAILGGALLFNALTQEVLVRGYTLQAIEARFGTGAALILSSLVFVVLHAGAVVEGGAVPATNLFAAGLLLGLAYTTTRNLWLPIGLHFSWNYLQGPVLGIAVTGQELDGGWRMLRTHGPALLTGGEFGLEGGLVGTLATIAGIAAVVLVGGRRGDARRETAGP